MNPNSLSKVIMLSGVLLLAGLVPAIAGEPIAGLIENAADFDGKTVTIAGEVVGDVMNRGAHQWICVLDNGTAVGVWAESSSVYSGIIIGGYGARGDTVRVTGTFHRACGDHGGDLDIHLTAIERIAPGAEISHPVRTDRAIVAFLFCSLGAIFTVLWRARKSDA